MPLSQPARTADAEPRPGEAVDRGFAARGFALDVADFARGFDDDADFDDDVDAAFDDGFPGFDDGFAVDDADRVDFCSLSPAAARFAVDAGSEASAPGFGRDRGTREPAGFAGRRGVREESPFIALLMTARKTTTGAATRPPPSRCRYAITP